MTLRARDIHEHFCRVGDWVDWQGATCDGFKHGNPDAEVKGIAVGWQSLQATLQEAHDKGCNLFITHEPTFYSHMDDDASWRATAPAQAKLAWLDRTGMVVYRCHDLWDVFPRLGIVDAWSEFLGLGQPIATAKYYNLHAITPAPAWELAERVCQRVAKLGEQAVQFVGVRWQSVSKVAVGTGAISNARKMVELGADAIIATDDGLTLWRDAAWLADLGIPLVIVNHATAEIPGLLKLVEYLHAQFPGVPVEFVGPTCQYEIMASERMRDVHINMRRDTLADLPPLRLPEGYEARPMKADEVWAYLQVMNHSIYAGDADQRWFERTYSNDPDYDPSYLMLIWKGERPVACAGAWHNDIQGERWGMIHFVGADDSERGKGLGVAVTLAALHRLRERGFTRAMLGTQVWRMAAIAAYTKLGFKPWPDERVGQEVWDKVLANLETWRRQGDPRPR